MVGMKGLEPSRLAALAPKASVSTNSTTSPLAYSIADAAAVCHTGQQIDEDACLKKPQPKPIRTNPPAYPNWSSVLKKRANIATTGC